jgi:hypothetical protein
MIVDLKNKAGRWGVLEFNTYLRREGCWEITHIDTRGEGHSDQLSVKWCRIVIRS